MLFKKETQTSPNHIRCVARLITNFGRRIKKKRESHKSSSKFQHQGRLSYPIRSISSILKKPTDKIEKEASRGIVNNIECKDRDCV